MLFWLLIVWKILLVFEFQEVECLHISTFDLLKKVKIIWSHDQKNFWSPEKCNFWSFEIQSHDYFPIFFVHISVQIFCSNFLLKFFVKIFLKILFQILIWPSNLNLNRKSFILRCAFSCSVHSTCMKSAQAELLFV